MRGLSRIGARARLLYEKDRSPKFTPLLPFSSPPSLEGRLKSAEPRRFASSSSSSVTDHDDEEAWRGLARQGVNVNPCRSPYHPAAGLGLEVEDGPERAVQDAYDPESTDFVSGPNAIDGMYLKSFRMASGGLRARFEFDERFECAPGIVSPGMIGAVLESHGNWTAGIGILDRQKLPKPPLMLAKSYAVSIAERAATNETFTMTSRILHLEDSFSPSSVRVEVTLNPVSARGECRAVATAEYERIGAVRSL